jgi:integrase/recombinase XerC
MGERARVNRDFTVGPVYDPALKRWIVEIYYPDGRRVRKRFRDQRKAQRFWNAEQGKIADGTWAQPTGSNTTLGDACDKFREFSKVQHRSYDSYYRQGLEWAENSFGPDTPLSRITAAMVENAKISYAATGVTPSTVDRRLEVLRALFNWCISHGLCSFSPMKAVKFFRQPNEIVRYLSPDQYEILLEAADEGPPHLRPIIELAVNLGLRRRNLLDLELSQADTNARVVRIERKTKNRRPLVLPMNDTVYSILRALKDRSGGSPYFFSSDHPKHSGAPLVDVKKAFKTALRRANERSAGIDPHFRFHDLRHTYGAWLVMFSKANIRAVQQLMGHRTIQQTERYTGLKDEYLAQQVKALDQVGTPASRRKKRARRKRTKDPNTQTQADGDT